MSVEVNPQDVAPEIEFAKYLSASLIKDAYFQVVPQLKAMVRRDFGAMSMVFNFTLQESSDADLIRSLETLKEFAEGNTNKQAVAFTLLFVCGDWSQRQALSDQLSDQQRIYDQSGILSDFVLIDCGACTQKTLLGHKIEDKKVRKVLERVLLHWSDGTKSHQDTLEETKQALAARSKALRPVTARRGPNPVFMLIFANILLFVGGLILENRTGTDWFVFWGIQDNGLILSGEVWRLFTSMFLHADLAHLGGNMLFLYMLGRSLYPYYSNGALWGMYFISGLVGNLAGLLFTNYLSLGASGAIMGLGGVLIYRMFWGQEAKAFRHGSNFVSFALMVGYNLVYGLVMPGIDNYGHFGGFIGGILVALFVQWWGTKKAA